jgi:hypothetical protein
VPSFSRVMQKLARVSVLGVAVGALAGGFIVVEGAGPAGASGTLYVSSYGSDTANNCTSSSTPCLTLQHAYDEAGGGTTTIELAAGTYKGDFGVAFSPGTRVLEKNLDIVGDGNGGSLNATTTTISGEGQFNAVVNEPTFTDNLTDLVVNDATSEAISNNGHMTLTDVTVGSTLQGPPYVGAGIANNGTLTMDGGSISGNTATTSNGGGLFAIDGVVTLDNVSLTHDSTTSSSGEGGGIYNYDATVHLQGTTNLHNDSATVDGGGMESCHGVGAVTTFGPDVVITGNAPNQYSTADPAHDC